MSELVRNIEHLMDVPMALAVELGRKFLPVSHLLDLKAGAIVLMDKSAGDNVDLVVGQAFVGAGEIVVIEDMIGIRVTDINTGGS